jgi:uncharacterized protein (TIGR02391 family)
MIVVEANKNPEYLRKLSAAVASFRAAFLHLMELYGDTYTGTGRGIPPAVSPNDDADPDELKSRAEKVAVASGRAASATALTNMYFSVNGRSVDPITNWNTVTQPKSLLEPENIIDACDQMLGRLDDLIAKAEAEAPPEVGVTAMHPLVWGAAKRLWRDHHYRQAVAGAAEAVINHVKNVTGRNDVSETSLWTETFSDNDPLPGRPRLRWPGSADDNSVKTMQCGLRSFSAGVQQTIRNPAIHVPAELTEQEAIERLAALSLLATWVDQCVLVQAPAPPPAATP